MMTSPSRATPIWPRPPRRGVRSHFPCHHLSPTRRPPIASFGPWWNEHGPSRPRNPGMQGDGSASYDIGIAQVGRSVDSHGTSSTACRPHSEWQEWTMTTRSDVVRHRVSGLGPRRWLGADSHGAALKGHRVVARTPFGPRTCEEAVLRVGPAKGIYGGGEGCSSPSCLSHHPHRTSLLPTNSLTLHHNEVRRRRLRPRRSGCQGLARQEAGPGHRHRYPQLRVDPRVPRGVSGIRQWLKSFELTPPPQQLLRGRPRSVRPGRLPGRRLPPLGPQPHQRDLPARGFPRLAPRRCSRFGRHLGVQLFVPVHRPHLVPWPLGRPRERRCQRVPWCRCLDPGQVLPDVSVPPARVDLIRV